MRYCNKIILSGIGCLLSFAACNYKSIADTEYLPQQVYIAAAVSGTVYTIESIPVHSSNTPTPGTPFRFVADRANNLFEIPMAVLRSGIDNKGAIRVGITPNNDTIVKLVAAERLTAIPLPAANFTLPSSVTIADGATRGNFSIPVSLSYLMENAPENRYALAFDISSDDREVNRALGTLVVVVDTRIMVAAADFTAAADLNQWNRIVFTNTSSHILTSEWDFGDGTTSTETNPSHVYQQAGEYDVSLTVTGISGERLTRTISVVVINTVQLDKSLWTIHDFTTQEPTGEGPPNGHAVAAIDGNTGTFWHSQWSGGNAPLPHSFSVDMGREYTLVSLATIRRLGDGRGQQKCNIYTSLDGSDWTFRGEFEQNASSDAPYTITMPSYERARYFRYEVTECPNGFSFLAEISAYGAE